MDYIKDAEYMVEQFLIKKGISQKLFSGEQFDQLVFRTYKNYYGYEMDEEYAVGFALTEICDEYGLTIPSIEMLR